MNERALWVDVYQIERWEMGGHPSTYVAIQLITYWKLVDIVYYKTLNFSYSGGYHQERLSITIASGVSFEDFRQYLLLASGTPRALDPFMIKEWRDTKEALEHA